MIVSICLKSFYSIILCDFLYAWGICPTDSQMTWCKRESVSWNRSIKSDKSPIFGFVLAYTMPCGYYWGETHVVMPTRNESICKGRERRWYLDTHTYVRLTAVVTRPSCRDRHDTTTEWSHICRYIGTTATRLPYWNNANDTVDISLTWDRRQPTWISNRVTRLKPWSVNYIAMPQNTKLSGWGMDV